MPTRNWCAQSSEVNDVTQAAGLMHSEEEHAWDDAAEQGMDKRQEIQGCKAQF